MVEEKNNLKYSLVLVLIVSVVAIVSLWMMGMDNAFKVTNNENIITADDSDKSDLAGRVYQAYSYSSCKINAECSSGYCNVETNTCS